MSFRDTMSSSASPSKSSSASASVSSSSSSVSKSASVSSKSSWSSSVVFVVLIRALRPSPRLRTQLDQVLLGHDPCERDQGFVDRSKLSDTELRIRDPARSPAGLLQGEKADNLLDRFVPQVHRVQDRRAVGIEKRNFYCGEAHRRTVALVEKRESALQAFPEVGAVLLNRGAQADGFELPQGLYAVTAGIDRIL